MTNRELKKVLIPIALSDRSIREDRQEKRKLLGYPNISDEELEESIYNYILIFYEIKGQQRKNNFVSNLESINKEIEEKKEEIRRRFVELNNE